MAAGDVQPNQFDVTQTRPSRRL